MSKRLDNWNRCCFVGESVSSSFMDALCHARNKVIQVLSWRTVYALIRVLLWCLFPSLLRNQGNKRQNNPLVSAKTVHHSSTCIILYICHPWAHAVNVSINIVESITSMMQWYIAEKVVMSRNLVYKGERHSEWGKFGSAIDINRFISPDRMCHMSLTVFEWATHLSWGKVFWSIMW